MADKSVLEKYYDEEARKRRAPTSKEMERDAIEPDTTLEGLLIGPGRAAAGAIAKGVNKIVNKAAPRVTTPKIGSEVPDSSNRIRNLFDPDPPFPVLSPSQRAKKEVLKNKQNLIDAIEDSMEVGTRRAAGEFAADMYDRFNQEKNPSDKLFKSGGKVSNASNRADGCCVKGKTKGRYL
jgi:hypothetical protein